MGNAIKNSLFGGTGATTRLGDFGLMLLRVGAGGLMAFLHGFSKVYNNGSIGPSDQFVGGVRGMNFPAPTAFAWIAVLTEFLGAILLALGLMTRPVALALTFNMGVAAFVAHGKDALSVKEMALLFLLIFQVFIFTGAGRYGIDRYLRKSGSARGFAAHD
jgi:putative oxidoreductase